MPQQSRRKEELNKGASKSKKDKKDKNAAKKKKELQKRQEKPISFIDCPVCHKVLKHPVEIECGHVFCNRCLRRKMGRQKMCPICKSEIEYIHPSYLMRELVRKFGVKDGPKRLKAELLQVSGYYDEYAIEDPIVIAAHWTSGPISACLGTLCFCVFPSPAQKAVNMIEVVLGDCNLRWAETGCFWTLLYMDGDTRSASSLGDKFYLVLRIDRSKARAYQNSLKAGGQRKDVEMARLRKQNALMRHKMLELGENGFIRALAGRKSPRYSLKSGASLAFADEYPDFPVISPHTLRDLVLHNPLSKRPFVPPWNRMRSTSTGPLPTTREEDCRMKSHLTTMVSSRSGSPGPYNVDSARSQSPAARPKSPPSPEKVNSAYYCRFLFDLTLVCHCSPHLGKYSYFWLGIWNVK
ncbi:hypothetical protein SELMODRAFT_430109 [Selaginella moellendorffii]|uniref:RING-type domain-containing protein n=1 Tax=Selaginella moellendorffii TaxID=88036 RepID=D8T8C8_SELML|nr:hypothetical protein SELMODRAFT_430109 [Selaginella moellendorffii]